MDFALSEEQREHRQHVRKFAREVIRPVARRHDQEESTPWEVIKEARKWGLQGLEHMQRMGADPDGQFGVTTAEELHWGCAGIALAIQGSGLAAAGIAASGTPEQIAEWVPQCFGTDDEIALGAYAVTEPQAGSDVKSLKTTARRDGDEWVLNGTKVFITNGGIADVHVVVATVDPELGHRGQASFVVGKGTPGLRQGKKESKIGIRASHTAEVILEDCRIPVENLLGGMDKLNKKLERARSGQKAGSSNALATFEMTRPTGGGGAANPAGARRRRDRDRCRPAARAARRVDGPQRRRDDGGAGIDVEAQGRRPDDVGDHNFDGPRGPLRPGHRLPAREVVPRRQDLSVVRGHGPGSTPGDLPDAGEGLSGALRRGRGDRQAGDGCELERSARERGRQGEARRGGRIDAAAVFVAVGSAAVFVAAADIGAAALGISSVPPSGVQP